MHLRIVNIKRKYALLILHYTTGMRTVFWRTTGWCTWQVCCSQQILQSFQQILQPFSLCCSADTRTAS